MKLTKSLMIIFLTIVLLYTYNRDQISRIRVRDVSLSSKKLRDSIKITQISDFHSNEFVDFKLLNKEIQKFNPDILVLTGDILDSGDRSLDVVINLIHELKTLNKSIYFVEGNHEKRQSLYSEFKEILDRNNVIRLEDEFVELIIRQNKLNIIGLNFYSKSRQDIEMESYNRIREKINLDGYNIILRHSPNDLEYLLKYDEDLVLSGHSHGGQVRLPIIGAILSPGEGFFPKYDKGLFQLEETTLYIDSGLGNSTLPIRSFNPIQISNITINKKM